ARLLCRPKTVKSLSLEQAKGPVLPFFLNGSVINDTAFVSEAELRVPRRDRRLQNRSPITVGRWHYSRHADGMSIEMQPITEQEYRAILYVCILAAFADGVQDDVERAQIQKIVDGFPKEQLDLTDAYQQALSGNLSLASATAPFQGPAAKALAYEMAVG